jgi:hypothetical protein
MTVIEDLQQDLRLHQDGSSLTMVTTTKGVISKLVRSVMGLFLIAVGGLVTYLFVKMSGSLANEGVKAVVGWAALLLAMSALGLIPFWWGVRLLLGRDQFVVHPDRGELIHRRGLVWFPYRVKRFSLDSFDKVVAGYVRRGGPFGSIKVPCVILTGSAFKVELIDFSSCDNARNVAQRIAATASLPFEDRLEAGMETEAK